MHGNVSPLITASEGGHEKVVRALTGYLFGSFRTRALLLLLPPPLLLLPPPC